MSCSRGMTMLETVLALSLLASLASVSVTWAMGFARLSALTAEETQWTRGVAEFERSLRDDLMTSDAATEIHGLGSRPVVTERGVTLMTREPGVGQVPVSYRYVAGEGTLIRAVETREEVVLGNLEDTVFVSDGAVLRIELRADESARTVMFQLGRFGLMPGAMHPEHRGGP